MKRAAIAGEPTPARRGWRWPLAAAALTAPGPVVFLVILIVVAATGGGLRGGPRPAAGAVAIEPVVLDAYVSAAARAAEVARGCALRWLIVAAIGRVESNHAAGRLVAPNGDVTPPIVGVALDGSPGVARVPDTDGGRLDGDRVWDRAVGPMQFVPSSWRRFGRDGNGDGAADPQNVYDAALSAVAHLCLSAPGDYADPEQLSRALRRYNHSTTYVEAVLGQVAHYDRLGPETLAASPGASYVLPVDRSVFDAHPEYLTRTHHDYPAADIPVPVGTPVVAVTGGVVRATTPRDSRCGLGVAVGGDDGFDYLYCHGSELAVRAGEVAVAGQQLMRAGSTGRSTGPHLHFEIRRPDGTRLCPQPLLAAWHGGHPSSPLTATTEGCDR